VGPPRPEPGARFDLVLLGMGDNGHTASLFPGLHAAREAERWVVAESVAEVGMWRITLTPVVLNAAAEVVFLVAGADKAAMLHRVKHPREPHLLAVSSFLVNYPFANRLFPGSLDALEHVRSFGPTVILSDGDVVFQPLKVNRSGLFEAVDGRVLIYIHKEKEL